MLICPSCSRTRLISVVLPAPDGPDTMNKVPSEWKLLDILNLFADALDFGLQFYNQRPDVGRTRLRAHRIDFTQHLLREEVEFLACRIASVDRFLHLLHVMRQPR